MTSTEIVVPGSGELVSPADPVRVAEALAYLRRLEEDIAAAKRMLTDALVEEAQRQGSNTLRLRHLTASVRQGRRVVYDADVLEELLRAAGMPEARLAEIVYETVTRAVHVREAKKAAAANDDYAVALAAATREIEATPYVTLKDYSYLADEEKAE